MVAIVDTEESVTRFLPTVERMVTDGLIAISDVEGDPLHAPRREFLTFAAAGCM